MGAEAVSGTAGGHGQEVGTLSDVGQGPDWWLASDGKWYPPSPAASHAAPDTDRGSPPAVTDLVPGPGWWVASDGRWYPAELHPDHQAQSAAPPQPEWIDIGAKQAERRAQRAEKRDAKRLANEEKAEAKRQEQAERERVEAEQRALNDIVASTETAASDPAPLDEKTAKAAKAARAEEETFQQAMQAVKARRAAGEEPPPLSQRAAVAAGGPLFTGTSRGEDGRNSTVTLWPDRIERVKARSFGSFSKANQDHEVTPVKSVSSVQAKKDGFRTKVIVYATGNEIVFRLPHDDAATFRQRLLDLMLSEQRPHAPEGVVTQAAPNSAGPSKADQVRELAALRDEGLMTDAEFDAKRREILGL
jgi:hypothetical protein